LGVHQNKKGIPRHSEYGQLLNKIPPLLEKYLLLLLAVSECW